MDVETSGLSALVHDAIEVSWWNLSTGEKATFIPAHDSGNVCTYGQETALQLNGYRDRIAGRQQDSGEALRVLYDQLRGDPDGSGNTLAGSNPAFDAGFLAKLLRAQLPHLDDQPWHHRLLDLSAYAAWHLHHPGNDLPGLATVCAALGVDPPDHTAEGDVRATGECLYRLGAVERP